MSNLAHLLWLVIFLLFSKILNRAILIMVYLLHCRDPDLVAISHSHIHLPFTVVDVWLMNRFHPSCSRQCTTWHGVTDACERFHDLNATFRSVPKLVELNEQLSLISLFSEKKNNSNSGSGKCCHNPISQNNIHSVAFCNLDLVRESINFFE
jgi:hypothetical protein